MLQLSWAVSLYVIETNYDISNLNPRAGGRAVGINGGYQDTTGLIMVKAFRDSRCDRLNLNAKPCTAHLSV